MSNPFTPTFGVTPPLLVGRDDVLDDFRGALDEGPGAPGRAMLLTGVRGAGKTVVLNACEDEARRSGWAVISETVRPGLVGEMTSTQLPELLAQAAGDPTKSTVTAVNLMAAGFRRCSHAPTNRALPGHRIAAVSTDAAHRPVRRPRRWGPAVPGRDPPGSDQRPADHRPHGSAPVPRRPIRRVARGRTAGSDRRRPQTTRS